LLRRTSTLQLLSFHNCCFLSTLNNSARDLRIVANRHRRLLIQVCSQTHTTEHLSRTCHQPAEYLTKPVSRDLLHILSPCQNSDPADSVIVQSSAAIHQLQLSPTFVAIMPPNVEPEPSATKETNSGERLVRRVCTSVDIFSLVAAREWPSSSCLANTCV
jgi:hypothetical protein